MATHPDFTTIPYRESWPTPATKAETDAEPWLTNEQIPIRPVYDADDLDGQPARLDIQGLVDLESTFRLELDVATSGSFNTESVYFLTSGQVFGGTLALSVLQPVTPGVDYWVIYAHFASGEFTVTGDEQFDEVVYDTQGVVCRQLQ